MFYYGVQWKLGCSPSNLWTTYFTSSKHVKAFRAQHGEPDIISIRKTFSSSADARVHESKVLKRMHCGSRVDFLNVTEQPCPSFRRKHSEESKAKMRASAPRLPRPPEVRAKIGAAHKGKPKSPESVEKMRQSLTGIKHTEQSKANMAASRIGLKATDSHRANIAAALSKSCVLMGQEYQSLKSALLATGMSKHLAKKHSSFRYL